MTLVLRGLLAPLLPSPALPQPSGSAEGKMEWGQGTNSQSHQDSPRHLHLVLTNPLCTDSSAGLCFLLPPCSAQQQQKGGFWRRRRPCKLPALGSNELGPRITLLREVKTILSVPGAQTKVPGDPQAYASQAVSGTGTHILQRC